MRARISSRLALVSALLCPLLLSAQPGGLVHRYSFDVDASDEIGSAHGQLVNGASVSGGALHLDGINDYVNLPNNLVLGFNSISIETWVTDDGSGTWARIYDFGNSTAGEDGSGTGTNYMFLSLPGGGGGLRGAYTQGNSSGEQVVNAPRPTPGEEAHIVWTSDGATHEGRLYVNGELVGSNPAMTLTPNDIGPTVNNWIGRSQFSADPYFRGSFREFRIYNIALSPETVAAHYQAGPDVTFVGPVRFVSHPQSQSVQEGEPVVLSAQVDGLAPIQLQWYRGATPIPGETNLTLTFVASLADHNVAFHLRATNAVGGVAHHAVSSNAVLSVTGDTTPPSIARVQSFGTAGVEVLFSEPVRLDTATNLANYTLTGPGGTVTIDMATIDSSETLVMLSTPPLTLNGIYTITVSNVRDQSLSQNVIAPGSQESFIVTPYIVRDIGSPDIVGGIVLSTNAFGFTAAGSGLSAASDQFTFAYEMRTGDFDIQLRLGALDVSTPRAMAGLMARSATDADAIFAAALATPGPAGCAFQYRLAKGAISTKAGWFPVNYPYTWLRLKRVGNVFTGYASLDGQTWSVLSSATLGAPATMLVGVAVSSGNVAQGTFASVGDIGNTVNPTVASVALPFEPPGPSSRRTGLTISEIMYHPQNPPSGTLEFIEIYNSDIVAEDLSGYRIAGDVEYVFPQGTILPSGGYLVVARSPSTVESYYGISGVHGPFTGNLPNSSGLVQLINELGGILLEVEYGSEDPWPVSPDGGGHSLVLSRPSYGEGDPRAWSASDMVGGSPGRAETFGPEPLRGVVINEILAHTDLPEVDSIELFNTTSQPINLLGCVLTDDPDEDKYVIGNVTIPARGHVFFTESQLGFALDAAGEAVFLKNPSRTRVLDAIAFGPQENGVSFGRYPDGSPRWSRLATKTFGGPNTAPRIHQIGFNEIMYHPISGDDALQYVELYNRGPGPVNLGGWKIKGGINFTFAPNTIVPQGGYLVVAKDLARLLANYPSLNTGNTVGNFNGSLSHKGERLQLTMPDTIVTTQSGATVTNHIDIVMDEVTYHDGGQWGQWADGGGSSLELIDPRADRRDAANWADSDETGKAPWTLIEHTGLTGLGMSGGQGTPNRLELFLQGPGECLVDDVEVRSNGGANRVTNPGFESGATGWAFQGTHDASGVVEGQAHSGLRALHVRATERGDTGANRIRTGIQTMPVGGTNQATIRAWARWLRGDPNILLRLRGNWLECAGVLTVPTNLGTPGAPNSRLVSNAGPAIYDVTHFPVLPAGNESVLVSARVNDVDNIGSVTLFYRVDSNVVYTAVTMRDDATGGDVFANDGIYSATIPGLPVGQRVAFYIQAQDNAGVPAISRFPAVPENECVIVFGEIQGPANIGSYRMWMTQRNVDYWTFREKNSNKGIDTTFVYGNWRVIYNAQALYTGSPWHTGIYTGPGGAICNYNVIFPSDDLLLGADEFVLQGQSTSESQTFNNDLTAQAEITAHWMARQIGLRNDYRRYIRVYFNGQHRGLIYYDCQQPNGDYIEQYFPNDSEGHLHKIEDWFEFDDAGQGHTAVTARLLKHVLDGKKHAPRYRWNFRPRAVKGSPNDFDDLFALVDAVAPETPGPEPYTSATLNLVDVSQWMRVFALQHMAGNWDSYGYRRGKNMYAYKPTEGRWELLLWDVQLVFGKSSDGPNHNLFDLGNPSSNEEGEPAIQRMYNHPPFVREFWAALADLANGPMRPENYYPVLDARYNALRAAGFAVQQPSSLKAWIDARRNYILGQLPQAAFSVNGPSSFNSSSNSIVLTGTAPVGAGAILVNGVRYPVTWTSVTAWSLRVPLTGGNNVLTITAVDRKGNPLDGASRTITVNYTGAVAPAEGNVVINEIMYNPVVPGAAYVELYNTHPTFTFDLSNWRLNGFGYSLAPGTVLPPQSFIVLPENPYTFAHVYGSTNLADNGIGGTLDPDGETLSLLRPGSLPGEEILVDRVRFETNAPWPAPSAGESLQLMDALQDNSRVGNWAVNTNTQGQLLVNYSHTWRYNQTANLDGVNWKAPSFLDISWPSGPGVLAGINNPGVLPEPVGTSLTVQSGRMTFYFRTTFIFTGSLHGVVLKLRPIIDDGAVFYLNGAELMRLRMPAGQINYSTPASATVINATYDGTFIVVPTNLVQGVNVLAVEVHQVSSRSSDIVMGLKMESDYIDVQATPGRANSVTTSLPAFPSLWLNEVQPLNVNGIADNLGEIEPWIELYNPGTSPVSLAGLYLSTNYADLTSWALPAVSINPGQFLVIWADGQTAQTSGTNLHVPFRLNPTSGSVVLSRLVSGAPQVVDYLNYQNLPANWSYGDFPDGQPFFRENMFYATPREPNTLAMPPVAVFINEWMADNTSASGLADPADGQFEDWFELYNPGPDPVDLGGYYLTDKLNDPYQFQIPNNGHYVIPPGGFLVVWADNEPQQNTTARPDLHVNFALSKDGEAIGLFAPDGTQVDAVVFGPQATDVSEGRFPDGFGPIYSMPNPTPGAPNRIPLPPEPPELKHITVTDGTVSLEIGVTVGRLYRVEYTDDLATGVWLPLTPTQVATGSPVLIQDTVGTHSHRFYRVVQMD